MAWLVISLALAALPAMVCCQCLNQNDSHINDYTNIADFGFNFYRTLSSANNPQNIIFSPYSIWSAFTLTYFGSKGNTEAQLQAGLRLSDELSTLHQWRTLDNLNDCRSQHPNYTLNVANRLYVHNNVSITPNLQDLLQREVEPINLSNKAASVRAINRFASEVTRGRIKDLVSEDTLAGEVVMVLVNAAYFKGKWQHPFNSSETRLQTFYPLHHQQPTHDHSLPNPQQQQFSLPQAPMMTLTQELNYGKSQLLGAQVVELPYNGDDFSMVVLLPEEEGEVGWTRLTQGLSVATLQDALTNFYLTEVNLFLPKFKMELSLDDELIQTMQQLNIVDLFDRRRADLTGFIQSPPTWVSKAVHKAFIEVNEEGTEAAAATAVGIVTLSLPPRALVNCNRPFVYLIRDRYNNIFFMGAYMQPLP